MNPKNLTRCLYLGTILFAIISVGADSQRLSFAQESVVNKKREARREILNDAADPLTLAYDEDDESAAILIAGGYERLANGAAGRNLEAWTTAQKFLGPIRRDRNVHVGATVLLQQRLTPSGQQLLVHAEYRPNYSFSGRGELEIQMVGFDNAAGTLIDLGRHVYDDFPLFYLHTHPLRQMLRHPQAHTLRIYVGQADAKNLSQFSFKYEIDGRMGEMTVQILDPDENSDTPHLPRLKLRGRNGIAVLP